MILNVLEFSLLKKGFIRRNLVLVDKYYTVWVFFNKFCPLLNFERCHFAELPALV